MSARSRELDRKRDALQLRSAGLRMRLALQGRGVAHALSPAVTLIDGAGRLVRWLRRHPLGLAALIMVKKPRRMLRWARFGLRIWLWLRLGAAKSSGTP